MRFPDFYVIGGAKCGSSDLCFRLASHPSIFFSKPKELHFFDRDEVAVFPHPFFERFDEWLDFDWAHRRATLLRSYGARFQSAQEHELVGEGTPTYLPSSLAPARIHEVTPDARLIVLLRHPVHRAYSHYWQHIKMRRSTETFENHIRYERSEAMLFGHYEEQLRRWLRYFPIERFRVLLFENYRHAPERTCAELFGFLGVPPYEGRLPNRQNEAAVPLSPFAQRALNRILRAMPAHHETIEYERSAERGLLELTTSKVVRGLGALNLSHRNYPPLNQTTFERIDAYFRRVNSGLAELINQDLSVWGWT